MIYQIVARKSQDSGDLTIAVAKATEERAKQSFESSNSSISMIFLSYIFGNAMLKVAEKAPDKVKEEGYVPNFLKSEKDQRIDDNWSEKMEWTSDWEKMDSVDQAEVASSFVIGVLRNLLNFTIRNSRPWSRVEVDMPLGCPTNLDELLEDFRNSTQFHRDYMETTEQGMNYLKFYERMGMDDITFCQGIFVPPMILEKTARENPESINTEFFDRVVSLNNKWIRNIPSDDGPGGGIGLLESILPGILGKHGRSRKDTKDEPETGEE
jgi:hypothetical protein